MADREASEPDTADVAALRNAWIAAVVCRALPRARFRPATLHGRAVRMVYQPEFRF